MFASKKMPCSLLNLSAFLQGCLRNTLGMYLPFHLHAFHTWCSSLPPLHSWSALFMLHFLSCTEIIFAPYLIIFTPMQIFVLLDLLTKRRKTCFLKKGLDLARIAKPIKWFCFLWACLVSGKKG